MLQVLERTRAPHRRPEVQTRPGTDLKNLVQARLRRLLDRGWIVDFRRHAHFEPEGQSGIDFTVWLKRMDGTISWIWFGVTISRGGQRFRRLEHPGVVQFCWPPGTSVYEIDRTLIEIAARA